MGRGSGGMTGTDSRIMARGSFDHGRPCSSRRLKAGTIFSRLMAFGGAGKQGLAAFARRKSRAD